MTTAISESNKALVQASFERWREGTGSPFELLAPEADWTIVGSSPLSKTYPNKHAFLEEVIQPFNARMATPLRPSLRGIYADGDMVIAFFDAAAATNDGQTYRNTYNWCFRMQDGQVRSGVAFFDTREFDELWSRVTPKGLLRLAVRISSILEIGGALLRGICLEGLGGSR